MYPTWYENENKYVTSVTEPSWFFFSSKYYIQMFVNMLNVFLVWEVEYNQENLPLSNNISAHNGQFGVKFLGSWNRNFSRNLTKKQNSNFEWETENAQNMEHSYLVNVKWNVIPVYLLIHCRGLTRIFDIHEYCNHKPKWFKENKEDKLSIKIREYW